MGWITFAAYVAGWVYTYRRAYVALDENMRQEWPSLPVEASDRFTHALGAGFAACFWPFALAALGVYRLLTPETPGEREDRLREREEHVARLERELGLDRNDRGWLR